MFEEILFNQRNRKLLIIGYGFKDSHINDIIQKAVNNSGLKIYIISPLSIAEMKEYLAKQDDMLHGLNGGMIFAKDILNGLGGYFTERLENIFPRGTGPEPQIFQELYQSFWDGA